MPEIVKKLYPLFLAVALCLVLLKLLGLVAIPWAAAIAPVGVAGVGLAGYTLYGRAKESLRGIF